MPKQRLITINDRTLCLKEWALEYGLKPMTLRKRLDAQWPIDVALTAPIEPAMITYAGATLAMAEWAKRTGIASETIRGRIKLGWTPHDALTIPANACRPYRKGRAEVSGRAELAHGQPPSCSVFGDMQSPAGACGSSEPGPQQNMSRGPAKEFRRADPV